MITLLWSATVEDLLYITSWLSISWEFSIVTLSQSLNENANFEVQNSYSLIVNVTDGLYSAASTLTVNISDVNESPLFGAIASEISVDENITISFGSITASDEDGDKLSYTL